MYFPKTLNKISLDATSVVVVVVVIVVAAAAFAVYVFFVVCHNDNHKSLRCYHFMVINNYIRKRIKGGQVFLSFRIRVKSVTISLVKETVRPPSGWIDDIEHTEMTKFKTNGAAIQRFND